MPRFPAAGKADAERINGGPAKIQLTPFRYCFHRGVTVMPVVRCMDENETRVFAQPGLRGSIA